MFASRNTAVIYIDRNRLDCFSADGKKDPAQITISEHAFKDIEVVNREVFFYSIHAAITEHGLHGHTIIVVLASRMYFEHHLTGASSEQITVETSAFLDTVPFEHIAHKIVRYKKQLKIIATNQIFLDTLEEAFAQDQCVVSAVIPQSVIDVVIGASGLNAVDGGQIIKTIDGLREYSLLDRRAVHADEGIAREPASVKKEKKSHRLFFLVLFFMILIAVLVVLLLTQQKLTPKSSRQPLSLATTPSVNNQSTLESSPSAIHSVEPVIRLRNGSDFPVETDTIRRNLSDEGIAQVMIGEEHIASEQTLITFSKDTAPELRDRIQEIITLSLPNILVQENTEAGTTVDIIIGRKM